MSKRNDIPGGDLPTSPPSPQGTADKQHENNIKSPHLAIFQWKPGQSGNPKGRPRKKPITSRYEEVIEVELPEKARLKLGLEPGSTYGDAIAHAQARRAVFGAVDSAREIREAVEGKSPSLGIQIDADARNVQVNIMHVGGNK